MRRGRCPRTAEHASRGWAGLSSPSPSPSLFSGKTAPTAVPDPVLACLQVDLHGLDISGTRLVLDCPGTVLLNGFLNLSSGCHVVANDVSMRRITLQGRKTALVVQVWHWGWQWGGG